MLGVRPTDPTNKDPRRLPDVGAVNDADVISPGEGLSTSQDVKQLRANPGEAIFEIESDDLGSTLMANPDRPPHCLIQPATTCTLGQFQKELADTRDLWRPVQ
ncbi:hypothetical protein GobsT_68490 [Gemmata obscuriglobus]|nr:hypothetical protein GobsT_68490 [Gemmata obscuriglobus]VTS11350.1 unnamed protein product [Gemmata obscuriglobus UQM 2246]